MKKIIFFFSLLCILFSSKAQTWTWARASHSLTVGEGYGVATDPSGNIIICGFYAGTVAVFGSYTISGTSNSPSYVVKYDANGNVLWARSISSSLSNTSTAMARAVCTDTNGNVFVAGQMTGSVAVSGNTLVGAGGYDSFLIKYDAAGNVQWARRGGGAMHDFALACSTDPSGNCYIAGTCSSSLLAVWGSFTLSPTNVGHTFVAKYDGNGNELFAMVSNSNGQDYGYGISCDNGGNFFICGIYQTNPISFGTVTLAVSGQYTNAYLIKFNSSGAALWGAATTGTNSESAVFVSADPAGDVYICGNYTGGSVTIGAQTFSAGNSSQGYLAKYSGSGTPLWTNPISGNGGIAPCSISAHSQGVFATGNANGSTYSISPFTGTLVQGGESIFVASYSLNGTALYATSLPDGGDDEIDIAAFGPCYAYIAGDYRKPQFTIGPNTMINGGNGSEGLFVAQLSTGANISISNLSIAGSPSICAGQTATLTAGGVSNFLWSNGSTVNVIYVTPTVNTTYSISGMSNCGTGTANITVSVNPTPSITIAASSPSACAGNSIMLTASGANNYTWSPNIVNGQMFYINNSAVYTVTGSSTYNCKNTGSISVSVVQNPIAAAAASTNQVCPGDWITLSASGASTYTWLPYNFTVTSFMIPIQNTITYTLLAANANCVKSTTILISTLAAPALSVSPDVTVCPGTALTLTVGGASTYTWNNSSNSPSINFISTNSSATLYVIGSDANTTCTTSAQIQVRVQNCMGLEENVSEIKFRLFPNPGHDVVQLEMNPAILPCKVFIYDINGRLVSEKVMQSEIEILDTSALLPGLYKCVVRIEDRITSANFVLE